MFIRNINCIELQAFDVHYEQRVFTKYGKQFFMHNDHFISKF